MIFIKYIDQSKENKILKIFHFHNYNIVIT